ncbi:MAG: bifunctional phosphoribosylaminoimidazolecarboxamide formyltransferase/IMP cyclohydrolase [Planctomycetes bacterium]|nr:bifunctional phosphoribosylaminoimidazolecarboxamide formyltransferase/IMP cyclohydrolase [Planctomycetota bacterium]
MNKIQRVIASVTDKTGLPEFAKELAKFNLEIISTGGTAKLLRESGLKITEVSDYTGFPEMLDGRIKTLHPRVSGGILGIRSNPDHIIQMQNHNILPIDMVIVNLYRFEETVAKPGVTLDEAIENIDIGGPSMIRAAAKNHKFVTVVTSPSQYASVIEELKKNSGQISEEFNLKFAKQAFKLTSTYDTAIVNYLFGLDAQDKFPETLNIQLAKSRGLRYGENPHQKAAFYSPVDMGNFNLARAEIVSEGKELSYNNILDLDAAIEIAREFDKPACIIIKHNNPCGAGCADKLSEAFGKALSGDPVSAFGSVIAVNKTLDAETAELMAGPDKFIEALAAPDFQPTAIEILTKKPKWGKSLRLVKIGPFEKNAKPRYELRSAGGGVLYQAKNDYLYEPEKLHTATVEPTEKQRQDLLFAWKICKHVKSNAIVLAKDETIVGTGAGQMSRVDSSWIAVRKAGARAKGAVLASDAFFPFKDALEVALNAGITAAIQPGGSARDAEVIALAKEHNIPMLITGMRHFKH